LTPSKRVPQHPFVEFHPPAAGEKLVRLLAAILCALVVTVGPVAAASKLSHAQSGAAGELQGLPSGGKPEGGVDLAEGTNSPWYASPTWTVVGVAALAVIVALIATAGRRDGASGQKE
jgi:hypothetical protein